MLQFDFTPFPTLETARLSLRQLQKDDAADYFFLLSDEDVMRYMDAPKCESIDIAAEKIEKMNTEIAENKSIVWGISLKDDKRLIGAIGFWKISAYHHRGEIAYRLHPDFWRKGLMTEALKEVLNYGFEKMNLHSVEANVSPSNEASKQLLLAQNFVLEAHFRENYYFDGQFLDSHIYSLLIGV
jgi:[ribosomal protein S5]-alanine N-acetyltransferase